MLRSIRFLPLADFRELRPANDGVVISILDESESSKWRPKLAGWRSALALTFVDASDENHRIGVAGWGDELTDDEARALSPWPGERLCTMNDARRIVAFVNDHRYSPELLDLIVHCQAGISRSAAVVLWASTASGKPVELVAERTTEYANQRLLRMLRRADEDARRASVPTTATAAPLVRPA